MDRSLQARSEPGTHAHSSPLKGARVALLLAIGVFAVSTGAVLALQTSADPLTKSAWRCGVATLVLVGLGGRQTARNLRRAPRRVLVLAALAGVFLALHFATWIASLNHTSVATSLLLVNTNPVWVALLAPFVNGDRVRNRAWIGVVCALAGGAWLALGSAGNATGSGLGAALAVAGAWGATGYFLVGRRIGTRLQLQSYLVVCYGVATLCLVSAAIATGATLAPSSGTDAFWLVALGLVPQLIGHTACNAALRAVPALLVALPLLLEPVVGSLLAWVVLGQAPSQLAWRAGVVILIGVGLASSTGRAKRDSFQP